MEAWDAETRKRGNAGAAGPLNAKHENVETWKQGMPIRENVEVQKRERVVE
jgi:hypothetical protein